WLEGGAVESIRDRGMRTSASSAGLSGDREAYERSVRVLRFLRRWALAPILGLLVPTWLAVAAFQVPLVVFASVPAALFLMALVAVRFPFDPDETPGCVTRSPPPWRLLAPKLSHWGIGRADLERIPAEIARSGNDRRAHAYILRI